MKALTIIILLLSLISCGKKTRNVTSSNTVSSTQDNYRIFIQCSARQYANNCTYRSVNYRLTARDFYARYCYRQYVNCLNQREL